MTVVWPSNIRSRIVGVVVGTMDDIDVPAHPRPAPRRPEPLTVAEANALTDRRRRRRLAAGRLSGGSFHDLWQPGVPGYRAALKVELEAGRTEALDALRDHVAANERAAQRAAEMAVTDRRAEKDRRRRLALDAADHEERTRRKRVLPTREREAKGDVVHVGDLRVDKSEFHEGLVAGGPLTPERLRTWPIGRYLKRGEITPAQAEAARRFRGDCFLALPECINGRLVSSYSDAGGRGSGFPGQSMTDSRRRYDAAMAGLGGLWPVLLHVVINENSASSWAKAVGKPETDGIAALRLGLDALVKHYRLTS